MAGSDHDTWVHNTFGINVAALRARGQQELASGREQARHGAEEHTHGDAMTAEGAQRAKNAASSDLPQDKKRAEMTAGFNEAEQGKQLREKAHADIVAGAKTALKGEEDLEDAQAAENSYIAHEHGGKQINSFSLVVKDYYDNVLSGGNARITLRGGQGIADTTFNMALNNDGIAQRKEPLVIAAKGLITIEVAPPAWLAKIMPDGALKTSTSYEIKPGDKDLAFEATQGRRELVKSLSDALATAKSVSNTWQTSHTHGSSHELGGGLQIEGAAENVMLGKLGITGDGHYKYTNQSSDTTLTGADVTKQASDTVTQGTSLNLNQPLFDLKAAQCWR